MSFAALWESLLPIGRDAGTGAYRRFSWTPADAECRRWFFNSADERGLRATADRNGNLWAWWDVLQTGPGAGPPGAGPPGAVVTGSHLDSVPDGGAYDGPLGVVTGFAAVDLLRLRGRLPVRPLAVAAFFEEEGGRFGVACLGSRLLTGAIGPDQARALTDRDGVTLAAAMAAAGQDPAALGPDPGLLAGIAAYVELHVEQGRALADLDAAIGVGERIWPHGRWRLTFTGRADHAGTTRLADRRDPMLACAATILAARGAATQEGALATVGKVTAEPGAVNAISSSVTAWLDARAPDTSRLRAVVDRVLAQARAAAVAQGVDVEAGQESVTPAVHAQPEDCATGVTALAAVLEDLACH